jgi:hypothetical protein
MNTFDDEMLEALANGAEETVYILANRDRERSADLLDDLCRRLHLVAQRDRAATQPRVRRHPSRKTH